MTVLLLTVHFIGNSYGPFCTGSRVIITVFLVISSLTFLVTVMCERWASELKWREITLVIMTGPRIGV